MDGIGAAVEAALKWITDDRKLRAILLGIVLFGLIAIGLKDRHIAAGVPQEWITALYAVTLFVILVLTVAALDVLACKAYSNFKAYRHSEALKQESLANFDALPDDLKKCLVYLKQQDRKRVIDSNWDTLHELVRLRNRLDGCEQS